MVLIICFNTLYILLWLFRYCRTGLTRQLNSGFASLHYAFNCMLALCCFDALFLIGSARHIIKTILNGVTVDSITAVSLAL